MRKPDSGICTVHSGTYRTMESSRQAPKAWVPRAGSSTLLCHLDGGWEAAQGVHELRCDLLTVSAY